MDLLDELRELGVDIDEGLDRVMGDVSVYEMMLNLFISSVDDNPIEPEEFECSNLEPLIQKVHMFKGVTGNLSLSPLYTAYQKILEDLRAGQTESARAGYEQLGPVQVSIVDCLRRHQTA